ncbi:myelin-associated glycoprotein-like isoform X2 [Puntigrus tetrazona]|uniref:myelin-associated glycoprotein-like isoform X2 n=1 Tax=Puntigrus tetrazona TaxID=1606681 RepID=UPI001C8A1A9E|nr:myelin-associated glycoprotein-like isoform X2 [Puntigrus tetrazona]
MSVIHFTFFIIISFVLLHTHSADYFSAEMPQTLTALTGSCVQIPCAFNISNFEDKCKKTKSIHGIWLRNISHYAHENSFIAFNSSKNIINGFSDIQMTGDLSEMNCTTIFYNIMKNHSDRYYFRLEMEPNVFRATFNPSTDRSQKTVRIHVTDSPQPLELKPSGLHYVMEGTTVNLSCSAEAPCPKQPPTISWSNIPESADISTQLQEKPDKTQSVVSYVTFKASYKDHRKNITCAATYPRNTPDVSTVKSTVTLKVLFPPKETHFTFTSVGNNVTLTCKSKASPATDLNYTWYKFGVEMPIAWEKKIHLTESQHQTGSYYCIAQNKYGKQSSEEAWRTAKGPFMNMFAGCVGGIMAVLILCAIVVCIRTITFNKPSDNRKDPSGWFNGTDYVNIAGDMMNKWIISDDDTLIVYYEETDISKQQNFCLTETLFKDDKCTEIEYTQMC